MVSIQQNPVQNDKDWNDGKIVYIIFVMNMVLIDIQMLEYNLT